MAFQKKQSLRFFLQCAGVLILLNFYNTAAAEETAAVRASVRCVLVEVYFRGGDNNRTDAVAAVEELSAARDGITIVLRDVEQNPRNQERLNAILRHFRLDPKTSPVVYACNRVVSNASPTDSWASQIQQLLQVEVFVRKGCSRCESAKRWLPTFISDYPGLELVYRDIAVDAESTTRLSQLVKQHQTMAASVPVFHLCDRLIVGFETTASTGERLRKLLQGWTKECHKEGDHAAAPAVEETSGTPSSSLKPVPPLGFRLSTSETVAAEFSLPRLYGPSDSGDQADSPDQDRVLPLPGEEMQGSADEELPLPVSDGESHDDDQAGDRIELPIFGRLSASSLGMPLFTIAVGLVDGFNPCAMWVLLFLLSILVNLKDRTRIMAIAGTFVIVSGLAYFAFMAAWLNVFLLIGYLRPIQAGLAVMAILIGIVHIKDSIAFKRGISLSIPESAKPGIYVRVRRIVTAEQLSGAVFGAIVLAILVNIIELLCTAGLPALYTNILMQQGLSAISRYAYLALYILAYMFDDSLMVSIVVLTLSKRKLQETQGRWLKLISGAAILLLGLIMLLRPEWLH